MHNMYRFFLSSPSSLFIPLCVFCSVRFFFSCSIYILMDWHVRSNFISNAMSVRHLLLVRFLSIGSKSSFISTKACKHAMNANVTHFNADFFFLLLWIAVLLAD